MHLTSLVLLLASIFMYEARATIVITYPTADTVWTVGEKRTVTWTSNTSDVNDLTPEITGTARGAIWRGAHIPTNGGEWNVPLGDNLQLGSVQILLYNGSDSLPDPLVRSQWFMLLAAGNTTSLAASATSSSVSSITSAPSSSSSLTSASSTSSSSKPTSSFPPSPRSSSNVGAIAGGIVGGVAALAILGLLLWFLFRRRHSQTPTSDPLDGSTKIGSMKTGHNAPVSIMSQPMKLYDPNDPSTFPPPLETHLDTLYEESTRARPTGYKGHAELA